MNMRADEPMLMPRRATMDSAGYDVYAPCDMTITTKPQTFDLGFSFEKGDMPAHACAILAPRSSTGNKKGLHIRGTFGLIDSDYHKNVLATLVVDEGSVKFKKGERILQFFIVPVYRLPGEIPPASERTSGYGSTGE